MKSQQYLFANDSNKINIKNDKVLFKNAYNFTINKMRRYLKFKQKEKLIISHGSRITLGASNLGKSIDG